MYEHKRFILSRDAATWMVAAFLAAAPAAAQPPTIAGCDVFPADNVWNVAVDDLPVDPRSATYVATIGATTRVHPDFGTVWEGAPIGIPYDVVPGTTATPFLLRRVARPPACLRSWKVSEPATTRTQGGQNAQG